MPRCGAGTLIRGLIWPTTVIRAIGVRLFSSTRRLAEGDHSGHRWDGHDADAPLQIDGEGDLVATLDDGQVRFHKPVVYQVEGAEKS